MKIRTIICALISVGLLAAGLTACVTEKEEREGNESHSKLEAQAKVTRADAEKTALAKVPGGTIKQAGIEREKGKLIWSFDIAVAGSNDITEVAVDALTGEVLAVDKETPAQQEAEKKTDAKKGRKEKEEDEKDEKK